MQMIVSHSTQKLNTTPAPNIFIEPGYTNEHGLHRTITSHNAVTSALKIRSSNFDVYQR